jgi:long-chain fatty acid transport protein
MIRHARRAATVFAAFAALGIARDARAAGLFFTDRGVRPMGRGGAFVAGADDLGAVWYNPAGLADAGTSILADFSWLHFTSDFTRRTQIADAAGTERTYQFPTVSGTTPVLPIPTLGVSYNPEKIKEWTFAFGAYAPMTAVASYPLTLADGTPSPSRYSLVSLNGSALVVTGLYAAYKPIEEVRLGLGLEALVGSFDSQVVFSACPPDNLVCAGEDPQYDAASQLKVGPIFAPSANLGATFVPEPHVRIGISGQLPFHIDAPATIQVRLPNAPEFDHASQQGQDAHVQFDLPAIFRIGAELRTDVGPGKMRLEAAFVREFWTTQHSIDITPDNIHLLNVTGFPSPFAVSPISIPRNFDNANSYRFGGEYTFKVSDYLLDARAGISFEQSAIPQAYLSPLTIDLNKTTLSLGGGLHIGKNWRFDAVFAHVFASDTTVDPAVAAVPKVNPVRGNPTQSESINGGDYTASADVIGVGLNYRF